MIKINAIDHINLNVSNLKKSSLFYQDLFGFEVKEEGVSAMTGAPYQIIGKSNRSF